MISAVLRICMYLTGALLAAPSVRVFVNIDYEVATLIVGLLRNPAITGEHRSQDQICLAKIVYYTGFCVYRGSYLLVFTMVLRNTTVITNPTNPTTAVITNPSTSSLTQRCS